MYVRAYAEKAVHPKRHLAMHVSHPTWGDGLLIVFFALARKQLFMKAACGSIGNTAAFEKS